jgi:DnaK suppressor protein
MAKSGARLTAEQLDTLRRKLEDERRRILAVLQTPPPTLPSDDERVELEERAQRTTERDRQIGIADRERALLEDVERALARLSAGTYGIDEATGQPISYERLLAMPWARDGIGA